MRSRLLSEPPCCNDFLLFGLKPSAQFPSIFRQYLGSHYLHLLLHRPLGTDLLAGMAHSRLRVKYHILIDHAFQMMFVSGETADVAPETTSMIEFIVQQQVMEMVSPYTYAFTRTILTMHPAHSRDRSSSSERCSHNQHRRPHFPHPTRPSQSKPATHIPVMEGCQKKCQRQR